MIIGNFGTPFLWLLPSMSLTPSQGQARQVWATPERNCALNHVYTPGAQGWHTYTHTKRKQLPRFYCFTIKLPSIFFKMIFILWFTHSWIQLLPLCYDFHASDPGFTRLDRSFTRDSQHLLDRSCFAKFCVVSYCALGCTSCVTGWKGDSGTGLSMGKESEIGWSYFMGQLGAQGLQPNL